LLAQELQEVITKHIGQELADNTDEFPYQINFTANAQDKVKIVVRWPDDAPPAHNSRIISSMLHHISDGHWKPPMVESVYRYGMEKDQSEVASQIIQEWGQASQTTLHEALCVSPRQVFSTQEKQ